MAKSRRFQILVFALLTHHGWGSPSGVIYSGSIRDENVVKGKIFGNRMSPEQLNQENEPFGFLKASWERHQNGFNRPLFDDPADFCRR